MMQKLMRLGSDTSISSSRSPARTVSRKKLEFKILRDIMETDVSPEKGSVLFRTRLKVDSLDLTGYGKKLFHVLFK